MAKMGRAHMQRNRLPVIHRRAPKHRRAYFYTCVKGKQVYLGVDHAAALRKFADLVGPHPKAAQPTTIMDLFDAWAAENPGHWTYPRLKPYATFAARVPLADKLPGNHFTRFVAKMRADDYSAFSIRECALCARRLIEWAWDMEWYAFPIPKLPKLPRRERNPKDIPPGKLDEILESLKAPKMRRAGELIRFILATGCRPSEARNLKWEHVDLARGVCTIPPGKTKTGHNTGDPKTIYLTGPASEVLKRVRHKGVFVFTSNRGKPYTAAGLRAILKRRGANPYSLRHTFAQLALDQDMQIQVLAKLLGHSSLEMVSVYAQVRDRKAAAAAKAIVLPRMG